MTVNDFHSSVYLSTGGEICQTVMGGEKIKVPLFISSMTSKDFGNELTVEYELSHINRLAEESLVKSSQFNIEYKPWTQRTLSPLELTMVNGSGLSKLKFTVRTSEGKVLHRNFMHFEVPSDSKKKLQGKEVITLSPKSFSNSNWSISNIITFTEALLLFILSSSKLSDFFCTNC